MKPKNILAILLATAMFIAVFPLNALSVAPFGGPQALIPQSESSSTAKKAPLDSALRGNVNVSTSTAFPMYGFLVNDYATSVSDTWLGFTEQGVETALGQYTEAHIIAGEFFNNVIYAYTASAYVKFDAETFELIESLPIEGSIPCDMTYDYSTGTMFAISSDESKIYSINIDTGVKTLVANTSERLIVIACTTDGTLYGVTQNDNFFCQIDKATGALTRLGNTGLTSTLSQSMAYDHNNGVMYWYQFKDIMPFFGPRAGIYTVNLADGSVTRLRNCDMNITAAHCRYTPGQPQIDLNSALNAEGEHNIFVSHGEYPWEPIIDNDRVYAKSTCNAISNGTSEVTLACYELTAGSILSFDWSVSSAIDSDWLSFCVNNIIENRISGTIDWNTYTYTVPTDGDYTFSWKYSKDADGDLGNDEGYLANISLIPYIGVTQVEFPYEETLVQVVSGNNALSWEVIPAYATNTAVSFSSSDPTVATVSETGMVEGISQGTAEITVTTQDGGFTDTVTVEVKTMENLPTPEQFPYYPISLDSSSIMLMGWGFSSPIAFKRESSDTFEISSYLGIGFAIDLNEGDKTIMRTLQPTIPGLSGIDTCLSVMNDEYTVIAFNDNSTSGNSQSDMYFTAPATGTYYLVLTCLSWNTEKGNCAFEVLPAPTDINDALNMPGNTQYVFQNDSAFPWIVDESELGRISLKSNIAGLNLTSTSVSLNDIQAFEGNILRFDYKVSTESSDMLKLYVNNQQITSFSGVDVDGWQTYEYIIPADNTYSIQWTYSKNFHGSDGLDCVWIDNVCLSLPAPPTLDEALNVEGGTLTFVNSEEYPWIVSSDEPGRICAKSDTVGIDGSSSAITLIANGLTQGQELSFDWKVSSEFPFDNLKFNVNGLNDTMINGTTAWPTEGTPSYTYTVPLDGDYIFNWEYKKSADNSFGEDCGWLDNVALSASQTPPVENYPMYGFISFNYADGPAKSWVGITAQGQETVVATYEQSQISAGEYFDGVIYTFTSDNNYVKFDGDTYQVIESVTNPNEGITPIDMTYDYSTGTMYAIDSANNGLYTVDISTGALTLVAATTDTLCVLACTTEGALYTISQSGSFYSVNKADGSLSLISQTGITSSMQQSMAYDHNNNIMYWYQFSSPMVFFGPRGGFYTLDLQTGEATHLRNADMTVTAAYCKYTHPAPSLPTIDDALNVEGAELTFTNDTEYPWIIDDSELGRLSAKTDIGGMFRVTSSIQAIVTIDRAKSISFDFKASTNSSDVMHVYINGEMVFEHYGSTSDWVTVSCPFSEAGEYTIQWIFEKKSFIFEGAESVWLDNIQIKDVPYDVNDDGLVNTGDVAMLLKYVILLVDMDQIRYDHADTNQDGYVNSGDAAWLLGYILEI